MASRLSRFMEMNGFRAGAATKCYNEFHDWTIAHHSEFYAKGLDDIRFHWLKEPDKIVEWDTAQPIWKAQWFIGGEANVYDVCIEEQIRRGLGASLAVISYREDGRTVYLTFNEVKERVESLSSLLKEEGIAKGDRICVMSPSSEYPYLIFYAAQKIGAVFIPLPTEIMDVAIVKRLKMTKPKMIFSVDGLIYNKKASAPIDDLIAALNEINADEKYNPKVIEIGYILQAGKKRDYNGIEVIDYDTWISALPGEPTATEPMSSTDISMILFTSGTTGTPKGTMHTYAALIEDMLENAYSSDLAQGDRFLWYTSPGWMMFPWLVMGANGLGASVVLYDGSPKISGKDTMLKFVEVFNITHLGLSPPLVLDLVESLEASPGYASNMHSLRQIRYTSSPLADSIADRLAKFGYPPNGACGGTDGCFCYASCNSVTRRKGAKMLPGLGIDVHVMVKEGNGWRDASPGEIGELVIKSPFPSMTRGLLNDNEERSLFRATYFRYGRPADEGQESGYWFHGDLASFDRQGYITIHGRADDLLVVHGNKLSPMDVQDAILKYNPEVKDAVPISMPVKVGTGGELIIFAVLNEQYAPSTRESVLSLEERIKDTVKDRVNKLAKPYAVFFVKGIPYTINNKPAYRIIKRAFAGEDIGDTSTIRNRESIDEILELSKGFIH